MADKIKSKRTRKECTQAYYSPLKKTERHPTQNPLHNDTQVSTFLLSTSRRRLSCICSTDCFAVRIAEFLINIIQSNIFPINSEGRFSEGFYRYCMRGIEKDGLSEEISDRDLLEIFLKQSVVMLRTGQILINDKGIARISAPDITKLQLYARLFHAFWNDIEWEEIFPSDTEMARELKRNRYFLADLILKHSSTVELGNVANEFFDLTGFSSRNNLFTISFLDFYFFTWLRNFGIIRYCSSDYRAPVSIQVTEQGRKFMKLTV